MTDQSAVAATDGRRIPLVALGAIAVVVLVVAVIGSFLVGTMRPAVSIHTAVPSSAEGAISIETGGWTYGVPLEGVDWIDSSNTWHDKGRPECLPPTGTTRPVTFGSVEVTVQGVTWRPVVWVDCR